ncbi:hypothetical protein GVY41_16810 [Frigidibacter albus]|uniref:PRC-barrel domain-containing protein n=1 Tax=Frigidibacter albus TaxID=1465486 RepID=A0A6L8VNF0_9RHOB|nr:hypothetical protein [Frigidibacter albus]MZQ90680.1 hypothetical protein [Frigidibacter albus]NBE32664.1 hypothetical protein [Frigidibacter albus]GGH60282.1 hypothetical protein GCM10011341_32380 [Frigidibacter albus]
MATIRNMFTTTVAPLALIGLLAAPVMAQTEASGDQESENTTMPAKEGNTAGTSAAADDATNPDAPAETVPAETGTMGSAATTATPDMDYAGMAGVTVVSSDGEVIGTVESASAGTAGTMLMIAPDAGLGLTQTSVSVEAETSMDADGQVVLPMTAAEFEAAAAAG